MTLPVLVSTLPISRDPKKPPENGGSNLQGGLLLVISGVTTPITGLINL